MSSPHEPNTEYGLRERKTLFDNVANTEARIIQEHERLRECVEALKTLGLKTVLTSGTFDLLHVGHLKYLEAAKSYGDILIVGVDSDAKVRQRKGESRPIVSQEERLNMLTHIRSVDLLTLKEPDEPQWDLIRRLAPDTLIVTEETYDEATIAELSQLCGEVVVLPPQAETSTSAKVRLMQIDWQTRIVQPLDELLTQEGVSEETRQKIGGFVLNARITDKRES